MICVPSDRLGGANLGRLPEQWLWARPPQEPMSRLGYYMLPWGHSALLSEEKSWRLPPQSTKQLRFGYFDIVSTRREGLL